LSNPTDIPIFFIVSKGRSGSTLLLNLLDANPNTVVPLESTFLVHLYTKYKHVKKWNKKIVDEYLIDLYRMRKIRRRWKLDKTELKNKLYNLLEETENVTYGAVSKVIYSSYKSIFPKQNIQLIGDKNPIYTFSIPIIKEIYPQAKFIHLVRDPRANVRSHIVTFKTKFLSFIVFKWLYYNKEIEKRKMSSPDSFLTVKYENLVESPEETLTGICNFLNVVYNPEMLDFYKKVDAKYGKYEKYVKGAHASLTKPINKGFSTKWKSFFSDNQQNIINSICEKHLVKYEYEYGFKPLSLFQQFEVFFGKVYFKIWLAFVKSFYNSPFWFKKIVFKLIQIIFK
jgi:hypothetical protein